MHTGKKNEKFNGLDLSKVEHERDIGVLVNRELKPSLQCSEAARRASVVLGQITRAFLYRDRHIFLRL